MKMKPMLTGVAISAGGVIAAGIILSMFRGSVPLIQTAANGFDQ